MTIRFSKKHGTVRVGQYGNAPIYLHLAFFIPAAILAWPFWGVGTLRGLALAVLFIAMLFASILLHELAHAVMARRYRLPLLRIDIHALGGLVQFWHLPLVRRQDFAITLAGPMANLAFALIAFALLGFVPPPESQAIEIDGRLFFFLPTEKSLFEQLLRASVYLNLGLCLVNLIPAFPLDGGKLMYLIIEERWGPRVAALIVSGLGLLFACVSTLVLVGTWLSGFPIWAPPSFIINWRAFQAARRGRGGWNRHAFQA
jgi:Zn-dependent protease